MSASVKDTVAKLEQDLEAQDQQHDLEQLRIYLLNKVEEGVDPEAETELMFVDLDLSQLGEL